jgi:hypothetical protein
MLKILCKACNTELVSHPSRAHSCGCSNMTMILNDRISANDLTLVQIVSGIENKKNQESLLSPEDIEFQEQRRKRKIRKLEFEVR